MWTFRSNAFALRAVLVISLLAIVPAGAAGQRGPLLGLDRYVEEARRQWEIPGLAIAVVKDGEVVYAKGFGVRDVATGEPVDEHTIFAIGSASKAFTAAAVARLVDEGRVAWDDPVTRHLPGFQVYDPYVTRELTVRDLLTHRSGLLRGDALWYATELSREQILERVRYQEPTTSFRSTFGYNNNMVLAAGEVVEAVTGLTWDEYVDRELFTPLGMERSTTSPLPLERMDNVAYPHRQEDGEVRSGPYRNIDNIGPAGSINSSVMEMTSWVKLQLAHGTFEGREILSEAAVREMHEPQTIIHAEGRWRLMMPEANFTMYGIGWFLHDYRGRKVVQHGGNIDGMHALVALLPEEDLGLVVLTNRNPNYVTYALMLRVFDAYLGGEPRDWSSEIRAQFEEMMEQSEGEGESFRDARVEGTRPSLALEKYQGTFTHPMYGQVMVRREGDGLMIRRGSSLIGDLDHWHFDTFRVDWRGDSGGESFATFHLDAAAEVTSVTLRGLGDFERAQDAADEG